MPDSLTVPAVTADPPPPPEEITLIGTVRDFREDHADFNAAPAEGYGAVAGTVATQLGADGRPVRIGGMTSFELSGGRIIPLQPFAAQIMVIGAEMDSGHSSIPVTLRTVIGGTEREPFGAWDDPATANVNDENNPREHVYPSAGAYGAGTPLSVAARSWESGSVHLEVDSALDSPNVIVLRDGDALPDIPAFGGQQSVGEVIAAYVDEDTSTVTLQTNQAIYLFELWTTDMGAPQADFQDLVVLVSFATDPSYFTEGGFGSGSSEAGGYMVASPWQDRDGHTIAPNLYMASGTDAGGQPISDTAGSMGAPSAGGVTSDESFTQWFSDAVGVNLSASTSITLTRTVDGLYEYVTDDFYPVDDRLHGNEGASHNNYFTFAATAIFTYTPGTGQFIEYEGGDGGWLFVDDRLVIDIGGVRPNTRQYAGLDRLSLTAGEHTLRVYHAQRDATGSRFLLRTNVVLSQSDEVVTVSSAFD